MVEWPAPSSEATTDNGEDGERPAKKQKTGSPASTNVIKITVSPNHQHAVVVTEDKLVRVFEVQADGSLVELSQRAMPKRPCAVQVLPDNATILCGDKFGDVYSLPLLPEERPAEADAVPGAESELAEKKETKAFKPSASNTTVHTKRNRKALEAQLKQKNLTPKTKEPLKFEHKLLLGHVSMLTDLTFATREVEGKQRGYIITADRDEHIRVSRGPRQSHVIEGYCLGHTNFVSNICLVPETDLIISGGGDDWIGIWELQSFKLKRKIDIVKALNEGLQRAKDSHSDESQTHIDKVAVSGIWIIPMELGSESSNTPDVQSAVAVACEGTPVLMVCPTADILSDDVRFHAFTGFPGSILDITTHNGTSIVTFDDRKAPQNLATVFRLRKDKANEPPKYVQSHDDSQLMQKLCAVDAPLENEKALDALLYGVANLRKRGYQNDEEGAEAEAEGNKAD